MGMYEIVKELGAKLILPSDTEQYEEKRQIWNSAIDNQPVAIVLCENDQDVVAAVKLAKAHNWSVSIKSGGHHLAGFAVGEGSLVLDMSKMKDIHVNVGLKTVEVASGVKSGELTAETQKFNLAVPLGTASDTGVFGVALGGGIGYLRGVHGLTCDNILGATIVTAEGEILEVNETNHPDLLWAIRGGGGNFGVVTKLIFQAYEVGPEVLAFDVLYGFEDAKQVFTNVQHYMKQAPNESVAVNLAVAILPPAPTLPEFLHFKKVIMVLGMYAGDVKDGERNIQPLRELAKPIVDQTAIIPYVQLQQKLDATTPPRANCYGTSLFFDELSEDAWEVLIEQVHAAPTPSIILQLWTLGGKMNEVTADESAFAIRDAKWALLVDALAMSGEDEACQTWTQLLYENLLPFSQQKASYLNAFCPTSDATANAFQQNFTRLAQVKKQYDPTNLFRNNHTIEVTESVLK